MAAEQLDAESLMLARQVLPQADDVNRAEAEMDARLAARGAGGYGFTGPTAGLFMAMHGATGVSMMSICSDPDGMMSETLAAATAEEIRRVVVALQSGGCRFTVASIPAPGGGTRGGT